jgi:hypothetical protein
MLVVQPLVENAIKHGIAPRRPAGRCASGSARGPGRPGNSLTVADTGLGVSEAVLEAGRARGIGLAAFNAGSPGISETGRDSPSSVPVGTTVEFGCRYGRGEERETGRPL